jgi:hypothetical protein
LVNNTLPDSSTSQDDFRDLSPIGTFRIGVEQAQLDHEVLLVVARQKRLVRSSVGNVDDCGMHQSYAA